MSCLWRKSAGAPCSCAYSLHGPLAEILGHLRHLGQATLIARQPGLSLVRTTSFGPNVARPDSGPDAWADAVSGLETAAAAPLAVYLLREMAQRHPLLEIGEPGSAIDLSIRLDAHFWESPAIAAMLRRFDAAPLACHESHRLGAGAWLDDWGNAPAPAARDHPSVRSASAAVADCKWLEVEINAPGHRNIMRFSPTFVDSDGGVLRIADRTCRHVVHADVEAPDIRLESASRSELRLFKAAAA